MQTQIPAARRAIIGRIVEARRMPAGSAEYLHTYYAGVAEEDLAARGASDLAGAALEHRHYASGRGTHEALVRAFNPDRARDGFGSPHTVIAIVVDDMPFLVDSIGIALARAEVAVHLIVHPVFHVRRDARGRLLEQSSPKGVAVTESWQLYEVDRQSDPAKLAALERAIRESLRDVRVAVEDWSGMRARIREIAASLDPGTLPLARNDVAEARHLLEWMEAQHFVFLGYRRYTLERGGRADRLVPHRGSGLGILRAGHRGRTPANVLRGEIRARARERTLLITTKANTLSAVHRDTYLDYVGIKTFDARGEVTGEHRFLGLWTSGAYYRSAREIPVLRRKIEQVIAHFALTPQSHDAKAVINVLETHPRDELFQADTADLIRIVRAVVNLYERRTVRLLVRRDPYGRFYSCLVYVPRDRYTTEVRQKIEKLLLDALEGATLEAQVQISDSRHARLHVVVRRAVDAPQGRLAPSSAEVRALERAITRSTMNWADHLREALLAKLDEGVALPLVERYAAAFPPAYQSDVAPEDTREDLNDLEALRADEHALRLNLHRPGDQRDARVHLKLAKRGEPIPISDMMPLLENFGLRVIAERPYELAWPEGGTAWIQDLELEQRDGLVIDVPRVETRLKEAVTAAWRGEIENDGFNRLVLSTALTAREIVILRAICKYLLQTGVPFSQASMERVVTSRPDVARDLVGLFHALLDPAAGGGKRASRSERLIANVRKALESVASLDDDRILRAFLAVTRAMLRTNYFMSEAGTPRPWLSFKLDPSLVPDLPLPRPKFEIFVYATHVEGVHLRMGYVARGGIRWSDRREDFRTEVLGLMKAQNVKNTLIVPVGAKGGFVVKRLPQGGSREDIQREVVACYSVFIRALLDLTDNIVAGRIVAPANVVRRDGDDAYLVVAADKGTASFSDIANAISVEYGFWLGDAFASGGSAGYDHKKMGITARGAWECVKRHFRELDRDIQREPFTAAGIGDMSGDVFGNGMLLSKQIRLVAAFNHQHIFIDPDPDAQISFAERARLFALPRSTWDDYDRKLLSTGGGIHARSAKTVPLSPAARRLLDLDVETPTPQEVIKAILRMRVDLLWNGGIGTYVKAHTERHAEAGDRTTDAVRVDGRELRARVIGEGGNLGLTQRARVEYALGGGRINTDFIDNSAGVNTSDVEVNMKILLAEPERRGRLARAARNRLLRGMTRDVTSLVLRNNYLQSQALSTLELSAASRVTEYQQLIRALERAGALNRAIEFLPSDDEFVERRKAGTGLVRPELCVVLSYSKIWLSTALLDSDVAEDPYLSLELQRYFPEALRSRFANDIESHRLRREIIVTATTNSLVNRMGPVFAWRAAEETGATAAQIARAYTIAREAFEMRDTWTAIEALDTKVPAAIQYTAMYRTGRLLRHMSYWLLTHRRRALHVDRMVRELRPGVRALTADLHEVLREHERALRDRSMHELVTAGVPRQLAAHISSLEALEPAFDLVELAARHKVTMKGAAELYFEIGATTGLDWIREQIAALSVDGPWQASARSALRDTTNRTHRELTDQLLASRGRAAARDRVQAWIEARGDQYTQWQRTLAEMRNAGRPDFATLSVGIDATRRLVANA